MWIFDNIPEWLYFLTLGFLISQSGTIAKLGGDRIRKAARPMLKILHVHKWTEWEKERERPWMHYRELVRYCKTCDDKEYKLLDIFCPNFKRKGEYCPTCRPYQTEWERRLAKMEIVCYDIPMEKGKKKGRPMQNYEKNIAIVLDYYLSGLTDRQLAEKYGYKDHSSIVQIRKRITPLLNIKEIRGVVARTGGIDKNRSRVYNGVKKVGA